MARRINPQDENAPLDEKRLKFVHWFRKYRDLYKAAERAGVPKNKAVATWCEPAVQEEFDRQEEAVRAERRRALDATIRAHAPYLVGLTQQMTRAGWTDAEILARLAQFPASIRTIRRRMHDRVSAAP